MLLGRLELQDVMQDVRYVYMPDTPVELRLRMFGNYLEKRFSQFKVMQDIDKVSVFKVTQDIDIQKVLQDISTQKGLQGKKKAEERKRKPVQTKKEVDRLASERVKKLKRAEQETERLARELTKKRRREEVRRLRLARQEAEELERARAKELRISEQEAKELRHYERKLERERTRELRISEQEAERAERVRARELKRAEQEAEKLERARVRELKRAERQAEQDRQAAERLERERAKELKRAEQEAKRLQDELARNERQDKADLAYMNFLLETSRLDDDTRTIVELNRKVYRDTIKTLEMQFNPYKIASLVDLYNSMKEPKLDKLILRVGLDAEEACNLDSVLKLGAYAEAMTGISYIEIKDLFVTDEFKIREIASILGKSTYIVSQYISCFGIKELLKFKKSEELQELYHTIYELYITENKSQHAVAEALGLEIGQLKKHINYFGLNKKK